MKLHAIVPVYNVEPYIRDFLDSLCIQTFPNVEYILINDGSTDKSGEICNSYAKKDSRIHVHHLSNGGVSKARNYALEIVSSQAYDNDYILFFDPDDYLTYKDALADIQSELSETNPDFLYYNYSIDNILTDNALMGG